MKIGIDILNTKKIIIKEKLIKRILSDSELDYLYKLTSKQQRKRFFSTIWTCKEAIFKLNQGIFSYKNISISHKENGEPYCVTNEKIKLSVSHDKSITIAVAILIE